MSVRGNKRKQTRSFRLESLEDRSLLSALLPVQSAREAVVSASFKSIHPGGANVLFVDGSVKFIKDSVRFLKETIAS